MLKVLLVMIGYSEQFVVPAFLRRPWRDIYMKVLYELHLPCIHFHFVSLASPVSTSWEGVVFYVSQWLEVLDLVHRRASITIASFLLRPH